MRKNLLRCLAVAAAFALIFAASVFAKPRTFRVGNLFLTDSGGISPAKLPRHEQVPVSGHLKAHYGTLDGSHPPAIETVDIDFDKTIQLDATGLPVCHEQDLTARSTAAAKNACGKAIVGSGEGEVEVAFPEQKPFTAKGPVLLLNGGVHGGTTLMFAHAYVAVPAPTAVIVPVKLTRIHRGHYGLHANVQIPKIAGGYGTVTGFTLTIDRKFAYKHKRRSYITASCPTGHYYVEGEVHFAGDTTMKLTHTFPCTPSD